SRPAASSRAASRLERRGISRSLRDCHSWSHRPERPLLIQHVSQDSHIGACIMRKDARIDLLRTVWLFERCTNKELEAIATLATPVDLPAGKVLARQGEQGDEFFVIVSGKAEATREDVPIATLGPGSFFGEMSLLERLPRVA